MPPSPIIGHFPRNVLSAIAAHVADHEHGNDVRRAQTPLRHASLKTMMVYTHVMNKPAVAAQSPLDRLAAAVE